MVIKECLKKGICGKVYREGDDGFELNYCKLCGAPLEEKQTGDDAKSSDKKSASKGSKNQGKREDSVLVDKYGYIHLSESKLASFEKGAKLILYKGDIIYKVAKVQGDKTNIESKLFDDVDNENPMLNKMIINESILLYVENGEYFIQNVSEKGTVSINNEPILYNKNAKIKSGQVIDLSFDNWIEFEVN